MLGKEKKKVYIDMTTDPNDFIARRADFSQENIVNSIIWKAWNIALYTALEMHWAECHLNFWLLA